MAWVRCGLFGAVIRWVRETWEQWLIPGKWGKKRWEQRLDCRIYKVGLTVVLTRVGRVAGCWLDSVDFLMFVGK